MFTLNSHNFSDDNVNKKININKCTISGSLVQLVSMIFKNQIQSDKSMQKNIISKTCFRQDSNEMELHLPKEHVAFVGNDRSGLVLK